jgi:TRAP transporter TAXI family solute receptor
MKKSLVSGGIIGIIIMILTAIPFISACAPKEEARPSVYLASVGAGAPGGASYAGAAIVATVFNKYVKGVKINPETAGGSKDTIDRVDNGDLLMGICPADAVYSAMLGEAPFTYRHEHVKLGGPMYVSPCHIVTLKENALTSMQAVKGKKCNIGSKGTTEPQMTKAFLEALGISLSDLKVAMELEPTDAANALRTGDLEVIICMARGWPRPAFTELAETKPLDTYSFSPAEVEVLLKTFPFMQKYTMTKNYKGTDHDVMTAASWDGLMLHDGVPKDIAYALAAAYFEHNEEMVKMLSNFEFATVESAIAASKTFPFHPGVEQYLRDKGFIK